MVMYVERHIRVTVGLESRFMERLFYYAFGRFFCLQPILECIRPIPFKDLNRFGPKCIDHILLR